MEKGFLKRNIKFLPGLFNGIIWLIFSQDCDQRKTIVVFIISLIPTFLFFLPKKKYQLYNISPSNYKRNYENYSIRQPTPKVNNPTEITSYTEWPLSPYLEGFIIFLCPFSILFKMIMEDSSKYILFHILFSLFLYFFLFKLKVGIKESNVYYKNIIKFNNRLLMNKQKQYSNSYVLSPEQQRKKSEMLNKKIKDEDKHLSPLLKVFYFALGY